MGVHARHLIITCMSKLRLLRDLIKEIVALPKDVYRTLEEEMLKSKFWELPNDDEDISGSMSPLSLALQDALRTGLERANTKFNAHVRVIKGSYLPEHLDNIVAYAQQSGSTKRKEAVLVTLYSGNLSDRPDIDLKVMVSEIAEIIRHELVHGEQLRAQAKSRGISIARAEKLRQKDPKQVLDDDEDSSKYFSLHSEIDAFAHQIGEELLRRYGKHEALRILRLEQESEELPKEVKQFAPLKSLKIPADRAKLKKRIVAYVESISNI